MISGIDPKVDYAFKRIFGIEANVPILLDLLNAVLDRPAGRRIETLELRNPFNEKETTTDKLSIVDVKARDERGEYYNVEMQMHALPAYPERVLYYWAKIYSSQLVAADDYDELRPTFSISFVNDVLFAAVPEYHSIFELRNVLRPEMAFSPCQSIHLVELPKFRKRVEELGGAIDVWCYFLKHAASLDSEQLPTGLHSSAVERALEVLNVISKTDLERERYLAAERWERDHRMYVRNAENAKKKAENAEKKAENAEKKAENAEKKAENAEKMAENAEKMAENAEKKAENAEKKGMVDRIQLCQRFLKVILADDADLYALSIEELESQVKTWEEQLLAKS